MKIVTYAQSKEFELTEAEFEESAVLWGKGLSYFCKRLGALLSPKYLYVETPRVELGKKIYIDPECKYHYDGRYFERNRTIYEITDGRIEKCDYMPRIIFDNMILEEDYLNKKEIKKLK